MSKNNKTKKSKKVNQIENNLIPIGLICIETCDIPEDYCDNADCINKCSKQVTRDWKAECFQLAQQNQDLKHQLALYNQYFKLINNMMDFEDS